MKEPRARDRRPAPNRDSHRDPHRDSHRDPHRDSHRDPHRDPDADTIPDRPPTAGAVPSARELRGPKDLLTDRRPVRLNRYLAAAGIASRRAVDRMVESGRVAVNGVTVERPGVQVLPGRDRVSLDGKLVPYAPLPVYIVLNKPVDVLTTAIDPQARRTVLDLLAAPDRRQRLFPVGRLDRDSEGLVLLTNDGTLAHRLLHPRYHVVKRYRVWTTPAPGPAALAALRDGVEFAPGVRSRPATVQVHGAGGLVIEIREGKKRQIRRMCEAVGLRVTRLVRVAMGPLSIGRLRPGRYRYLGRDEIEALWREAGLDDRLEQQAESPRPGASRPEPDSL